MNSESLSSAEVTSPRICLVTDRVPGALSSAETDDSPLSVALTHGKLSDSDILENLSAHLCHLLESHRAHLIDLLESNRALFSNVPFQTNVLMRDIDVGDALQIKQHPYRVNQDKRRHQKKQVDYMVQHGIAEPSMSVTKPDCYPLPRMEDCVDRVSGAKFVTKLDLLKGYWQVPLTDRAKIAAFVTPDDFLQYTVMAFGMRNAPATFQQLMNVVLSGLSFSEAYLDDLVVYSNSLVEDVDHLQTVFSRLKEAGLTVNLSKCEFAQATVTYLGKVVGGGQVRPVQAKVESIVKFPVPTTRTERRRYLAMVGYYRGFCKNVSAVASPLTDLLSPKVRFLWSDACQLAFEQTKSL